MKKLLLFIAFMLITITSSAHTVQTFWELRDDGTIRFWLEHWHGSVNDNSLGRYYIIVNQGNGNEQISGSGYYNETSFNNLPVQGTVNNRVQCPGQANTYNEWVYYDFYPAKCNEEVTITFVEGPPAETMEACTNGLFGYSITKTFSDQSAPTITANNLDVGTNQQNCKYIAGTFSNVSIVDNCDDNPNVTYSVSGVNIDPQTYEFGLGSTTVTVTATDNTGQPSRNTSSETFQVNVSDDDAPTFTSFPTNIMVNVDAGVCGAVVNYNSPQATDNCEANPTITLENGFASGATFPVGQTTVTYKVSDGTNSTSNSFTVKVTDNEFPTLSLQTLTKKLTSINGLTVPATDFITSVNDNCTYTVSPANFSFSCADIGTQQIAVTVEDPSGNQTTENTSITIEEPDPLVEPSEGNTIFTTSQDFAVVDAGLLINLTDNVDGAIISINDNFQSGDVLGLPTGFTLPSGVNSSYNPSTGVLTISGTITPQELQDIFQNVQFSTTGGSTLQREIIFNIGAGVSNSDNNHYYEYVSGSFTWSQAKADAATKTLNGLQGYLATATSATENEFIRTKLSGDGWIGGSDSFSEINSAAGNTLYNNQTEAEGKWHWITGPEAGTQFSNGSQSLIGQFANWNAAEPNNSGGSEHALQIYYQNGGLWNDLNGGNSMGYIVEYGGLAGDESCFEYSGVKTVELNTPPQISEIADIENCPSESYSFTVDITDVEDTHQNLNVAATSDNQSLVSDANISVAHNGTNYDVTIVPVEGIQATSEITITVTDSKNASSTEVFNFTAIDNVSPVVLTQNIVVQLDAQGNATITPELIDNGSSDNCEIGSMSLDITELGCENVGQNLVTLTVTDLYDNKSSGTAQVIVEDNISPEILEPSQLVFDSDPEMCGAYIDLRFTTQDNCATTGNIAYNGNAAGGLTGWNITQNGGNGWTVNGNAFRTSYSLGKKSQVIDLMAQGYDRALLDSEPEISISEEYRGIWPNFSDTYFFRVELRDKDGNVIEAFNSGTLTANSDWQSVNRTFNNYGSDVRYIFIEHGGKDAEFWAGHYGTEIGNLVVQVEAPGVTPNLPAQQTSGIPLSDEFPIGETVNSYIVMDYAGNTSTTSFAINVEDNTLPIVETQPITVQLDANGVASITPADIDNGSSDNCDIDTMSLDITEFSCADVATPVTVTLTVLDVNGNESSATATVTVEDNIDPMVETQSITVQLDANGVASITPEDIDNGSSDNCEIDTMSLDITSFDCADVDNPVTVTLTVIDVNGNESSATAVVSVEDNVAPIVETQPITVQLDANGVASITPEDIDNGSSDNCEIDTMSLDITSFDCADVDNPVTVTLTVIDVNGNESSATAVVTVEDNVAPIVETQPITVQLDANGVASITPADIDNGSSDNCDIDTMSLDITEFSCADVATPVTVTLTVLDVNGNESSATATVIVEDNIDPLVETQSITVQLDANGVASITPADIDNGSSDNCDIDTMSLDITSFDCADVDNPVTVTLTVTDVNGNESSATAMVTVEDNVAPIVETQPITVQLDANGVASITPEAIDNGSSDNCEIDTKSLDITSFDCADVDNPVTVTLMVTDVNGNQSSATATVTVEDNVAPVTLTKDITVQLDANGTATIAPTDIDNGSNDACGIASLSLDVTEFGCKDVGENTVTLTVVDNNQNETIATATVTVEDNIAPIPNIANLEDIIVKCEVFPGKITAPTAIDNCSELTATTSDALTYNEIGSYVITWNFDDGNGNSTTQTQNVIVEPSPLNGVTFDDASFEYNGDTHSLEVKNLPEAASVEYSIVPETGIQNGAINAGVYTVTANLFSGTETCPDTQLTATLTIAKAQAEISADAVQTFIYDGTVKNVVASLNHSETELSYSPQKGFTEPGTYEITVNSVETENYFGTSKEVTLVIEKAEFTGVSFDDNTEAFVYDGTEHSIFVSGLPEGATVEYTNNGQTNAGTYVVTAKVSKPGYEDLILTATMLINKASQSITFDELEDRNQLSDEHFQLNGSSTSGLPVMYSYTYESENPAATVGPRGFVRILGGGQITITATQEGNQNYEAATNVVRTLTISGSEARLVNASINGTTYNDPNVDIYYLIGCGSSENEVQIELEQNQGSTIDSQNIFTVNTPTPGIYRRTVVVTSGDGNVSTTYNILIEKNFNFEDIVIQKFNNVLLVNNNPETNGGYKFVSFRWYKNGSVIGNGQYFSVGNNANDQLDADASYYVVLETEDGEVLRTCISSVQLKSSLNVALAPNPVNSGGTMELLTDFPEEELETMHLSIHNLNGSLIQQMKSNRKNTSITLPYNLQIGVYILKIETKNIQKSLKFIVK
ncbi:HYR domain-containing protein [Salegentibacter holothuriorum]|uniref:HYR domain-containing protein n=1 Tax=Salegentibacter holothuriorum TaxID=241145 RepID=A0A1T5DZT9_9FLAO|nr:HYR domain-containing protein [Salegentibacter holothuriorum]SKB77215.1 HYR domain-containing protein [Salegentibacter holothuriorum]